MMIRSGSLAHGWILLGVGELERGVSVTPSRHGICHRRMETVRNTQHVKRYT